MQRSLKSRLAALERAQRPPEVPLWTRSYYLPHTAYGRVLVEAFRNGDLAIGDGAIVSPEPKRWQDRWHCPRIADVLTACAGWGDVFIDDAELTAARALVDLGWIGYGYRFDQRAPHHCPPCWQVLLSHAASHELYVTDKARYFAAHKTGRTFDTAIGLAAWRAGEPITTIAQVAAWLATAQPLTLTMAMIEAIGPITANALMASHYGYELDQLERADHEQ